MKFSIFLNEMDKTDKKKFKASVVFQSFLDNMQTSHYRKAENSFTFNVGKVSESSHFNDLFLLIREAHQDAVRLGLKDGKYFIVIETGTLPEEGEIKEFLESKNVYNSIIEKLIKYIDHHGLNSESKTRYEKEKDYNSTKPFEQTYQSMVDKMQERLEKYKKLKSELEEKIEKTGNVSTVNSYKMAINNLAKEYIGDNIKDFKKNANKVLDEIDSEFREHLSKENRKILDTRLQDFFDDIKQEL